VDLVGRGCQPTSRAWATPVAYSTRAGCEEHLTRLLPGQSVSRAPGGLPAEFITLGEGGSGRPIAATAYPTPWIHAAEGEVSAPR
jgi:hypothetical protein